MTPEHMRAAVDALFGGNQHDCARALGVTPRSIRNWLSSTNPIPADIADQLNHLLLSWRKVETSTKEKIREIVSDLQDAGFHRAAAFDVAYATLMQARRLQRQLAVFGVHG